MSKKKTRTIHRSAKTGRFIRKRYADKHPDTTVAETVPIVKRKKKRK
ncbi:MAG: hypothetical protein IIA89_14680 [Chloroflexi bacterium]|nr:hypothetical protein [Chloroflexota bacterium]